MQMHNYKTFNEARRHKNKPKRGRGGGVDQWLNQQVKTFDKKPNNSANRRNKGIIGVSNGMPMRVSERLKYVLTKIAAKNNRIAKELIAALDKPDAKFNYSYLDLTTREDTLSYLSHTGKDIPEEQKYERQNGKRQHAKVYKTIKQIFGAKYTKVEVNKFVSIYKEIYNAGPPKDVPRPKPTNEQVIKQITEDTKKDKLVWEIEATHKGEGKNWVRLNASVQLTLNKRLFLQLILFPSLMEETYSLLTINLLNSGLSVDGDKRKFINNYEHKDIIELIRIIREKFKFDVE